MDELGSLLALRPSLSPLRFNPLGRRAFIHPRLEPCLQDSSDLSCPFTPPSASLTFKPRPCLRPRSTPKPESKAPRLSFLALQHSQIGKPFFCILSDVQEAVPHFLEGPSSGFGYPLDGSYSFPTHGSLFQLPTLLGFPSRSFPLSQRSMKRFHLTCPLLRFSPKPSRP